MPSLMCGSVCDGSYPLKVCIPVWREHDGLHTSPEQPRVSSAQPAKRGARWTAVNTLSHMSTRSTLLLYPLLKYKRAKKLGFILQRMFTIIGFRIVSK
ncbi:unnamed protein product [Arctogadus glacialis]